MINCRVPRRKSAGNKVSAAVGHQHSQGVLAGSQYPDQTQLASHQV